MSAGSVPQPTRANAHDAAFERVGGEARVLGLGELLRPREAPKPVATDAQAEPAPPTPDPRELLEQESKRVLDAARKEGHAAGMRDAEQEIEERAQAAEREWRERFQKETERLADASRRLEALARSLPDALDALERQLEAMTAEAAFATTARVAADAARDEALVLGYCREALAEYALRPAVLRVHPDVLAVVKAALSEDDLREDLRIEGDARLAAGQCRIETAKGLYDISLEHRLSSIQQALLDSLDHDATVGREPRA